MDEYLIQNAQLYASVHHLQISERLGFGIHGLVLATRGSPFSGNTAIKIHRAEEPYERELAVYERLSEKGIQEILGFNVPQLTAFDHSLLVIEMTIVTRPFLLDFAGAYLDSPPTFTEEIWAHWEFEKKQQFGPLWARAEDLLFELRKLGIHMIDVSPSNIAF